MRGNLCEHHYGYEIRVTKKHVIGSLRKIYRCISAQGFNVSQCVPTMHICRLNASEQCHSMELIFRREARARHSYLCKALGSILFNKDRMKHTGTSILSMNPNCICLHRPGSEPRPPEREASMLPLNH